MNNRVIPEIRTNSEGQREYLLDGKEVPRDLFEQHMAGVVLRPSYENMMAGYRAKVRVAREQHSLVVLSPRQLELFLDLIEAKVASK
jgi:hypothetical protein